MEKQEKYISVFLLKNKKQNKQKNNFNNFI